MYATSHPINGILNTMMFGKIRGVLEVKFLLKFKKKGNICSCTNMACKKNCSLVTVFKLDCKDMLSKNFAN